MLSSPLGIHIALVTRRHRRPDRKIPGMSTLFPGADGAPPLSSPPGLPSARPASLLNYARYADPFFLFCWICSLVLPYSFLLPLRYLAAAYFAFAFVLFARQTMPAVGRSWPIFVIPVLCLISAIWAPSVNEAMRKSMQLALTGIVGVYVATRLSGRTILTTYFVAGTLTALLCLASNNVDYSGAWAGIFDQKNWFAGHMFVLFAASIGLALDNEVDRRLRLAATATMFLAAFMVVMSKSGTSLLLLIGASAFMFVHSFIWQAARRVQHAQILILAIGAVAAIAGAYVAFGVMQVDQKADNWGALGHDYTQTGRTTLWEIAQRQMAEHPLTGLGANGYWRKENAMATTLVYITGGHEVFTGYSFHNSYFENGVNYGYPGYWATVFLAGWALLSAGLTWLRNQTAINAVFLVVVAMAIVKSQSEADLALEFTSTSVLLYIAASRKEAPKKNRLNATSAPIPAEAAGQHSRA